METVKLGNIFGYTGGNFSGNVYDKYSLSPTLNTMQGGNKQPMIVESVRQLGFMDKEEPSLRIRKLTPRECWRLMGFSDDDFTAAEQVNSNTLLYKQAGNSIVVDVLMAIFDNLLVHSRSVWLDELFKDEEDKNNEND